MSLRKQTLREWWIHIIKPSKHEAITPKWLPQRQSKLKSTTYHCRFETKIMLFASRKWNSLVLLLHCITYGTAMTVAELRSDFKLTTDTPYLTLTGEIWGVCCKDILGKIDCVITAQHCNHFTSHNTIYLSHCGLNKMAKSLEKSFKSFSFQISQDLTIRHLTTL